jgi:hypothetical protein
VRVDGLAVNVELLHALQLKDVLLVFLLRRALLLLLA